MKFSALLLVPLLIAGTAHAQSVVDAQVIAVQVSRLPSGSFSPYQGRLPDDMRAFDLALREWNAGTAILLRLAPNKDAKFKFTDARLISFQDDAGKNLAKLPEGAGEDTFNRRMPVTFVQSASTGEVLICVASLRSPSAKASRLAGEIEFDMVLGSDAAKESEPVTPKEGATVIVGPYRVTITGLKRVEASDMTAPSAQRMPPHTMQPDAGMSPDMPPGVNRRQRSGQQMPSQPQQPQDTAPRVQMTFRVEAMQATTWKLTSVAIVEAASGSESKFEIPDGFTTSQVFSTTLRNNNPLKFKISVFNAATKTTTKVRFNTSLGVSEE
jgi:hypothetical protein